jgi:putative sigma-54 modulation protein
MKVNIQSIHFDADIKLIEFITKKVQKVNTLFDEINFADVFLRLEKDSEKNNKTVEIKINILGNQLFAQENSNTFETATDLAIDKVKAQVRKLKERVQEKN